MDPWTSLKWIIKYIQLLNCGWHSGNVEGRRQQQQQQQFAQ